MSVQVKDLVNQIGYNGPRAILYCPACGNEASANRGDYFMAKPNTVLRCECGMPFAKVVKSTVFSHVALSHI